MAGPALLSRAIRRGDLQAPNLPFLGSPKVSTLLSLLAIGEMVADKTPLIPSRTSLLPLLGRALSGALVGATLFASKGRAKIPGAALGALCAAIGAYAGENFRAVGAERLQLPDTVLGHLEDGVVFALGTRLLQRHQA
jgi:uncharacterized membrane protein